MTEHAAAWILLASASPRRAELLRQIGVPFRTVAVTVDERGRPGEDAAAQVQRLARAKAVAGLSRPRRGPALPVLGADTLVVAGGEVLGKPASRSAALAMLQRLSGQEHEVLTAVALATGEGVATRLSRSRVRFRPLAPGEAEAYWATGEPQDKAGAYAVQGLGAIFVQSLCGSYSGVMGLPLCETAMLLEAAGIPLLGSGRQERT